MKIIRILAFVIGGITVLVLVGVMLALMPSVQTWAMRKAVAGQPGLTIEVGRVAAGLSAATLTDVRVVKDGAIITAKEFSAKYSAWDYLLHRRINVEAVSGQDLVLDLRQTAPPAAATPAAGQPPALANKTGTTPATAKSASAGAKPAFNGLLDQARLPLDVRVVAVAMKGRALLPQEQSANFDVRIEHIETGQRGKFEWTVDFSDAKKDQTLQALHSSGTAGFHISNDHRIDLVEVDVTAAAEGAKLPKDRLKITAKAEQPTAGGNENYSIVVGLMRDTTVDPILKSETHYDAARHDMNGSWDISVRSEQLAAVLAGLGLPELTATGAGKFTLNPGTVALTSVGDLQVNLTHLEKISPELAAVGSLQFRAGFDGGWADNTARLERFQVEVSGADGKKLAQINTLQRVTFEATSQRVGLADPKGELARVALQALPLAWAQSMAKPMVIESGDLSLVMTVDAEADGSHIRAHTVEPLLIRSVTVRQADKKIVDQVTLSVRPQVDYSATTITAELADLKISMAGGDAFSGKLGAEITNAAKAPVIAFTAELQAKVISALKPYLPIDPGPLTVAFSAAGKMTGQTVELAKASSTVNRDGGALLTGFELQQAVSIDLTKKTFAAANPSATVARLRVGEIPLSWAEGFVPKSKFAGALAGAAFEVSFRTPDDLALKSTDAVVLRGIGVTMDGKALLQTVDVSVDFSATKKGETVGYEVRNLELKQGTVSLATFAVTGEAKLGAKMSVTAKGTLAADAAALLAQPALAAFATVSRGTVASEFEATYGDSMSVKAALTTKNLTARQNNQALGDIELKVSADLKSDGSGTVNLPLVLTTGGRRSDLTIDGSFARAGTSYSFTGKIGSNQLIADDFQPLAALAPPSQPTPAGKAAAPPSKPVAPPPAQKTTPTVVTADTEAFWKSATGHAELDLKKVVYGKDYLVSGIRGAVTLSDTRLALEALEGRFKEDPFKVTAAVTFAAKQPQPYALTGSADVSNLDVGEILRVANPNEKPSMETKVTVAAKFNGNGITLSDLLQNAFGNFDVTGSKGVLRALGRKGEAVSTASSILGLIGAARGSDTTVALSSLGKELNEMPFDLFKMQVTRDADLNLKLTTVEFLSGATRVSGTGSITHQKGVLIQNQPLQLEVKLAAKEHMAQLLNRLGALSKTADDKGYFPMTTPIKIQGTAADNSNDLWKTLGTMAAKAAVGSFLK